MSLLRAYLMPILILIGIIAFGYLLLRPATDTITVEEPVGQPDATTVPSARTYRIVTLLPKDAIPAIDDPRFYPAAEADAEYAADELVLGVSLNGDSRAYSTSLLNHHEIVNDTVGGRKIAVTW